MQEYCKVIYGDQEVGYVHVNKDGLYLLFEGTLTLPQDKIWRVIATTDNRKVDLGICLRDSVGYVLRKKLPAKLFGDADWDFKAVDPYADSLKEKLENQPFDDLDRIEQGRLVRKEDGSLIIIYSDE